MSYVFPGIPARRSMPTDVTGQFMMSVDTFIGDNVYNHMGERLGNIQDIVVDVRNNKLRYAIVSSGRFLEMEERLLVVPWSALHLNPGNGRILLDLEVSRISNAPGFDRNHWANMNDSTWTAGIHSYYGTSPD